jgi:hypothetical protein
MTEPLNRTKAKRRTIGDIVKIPLGQGTHAYARVLAEATFAFYDSLATEELALERVVKMPILFFVAVMNHAIKTGRWPIVGHLPLEDGLRAPPKFIQDPLNLNSFSIYEHGQIRPASRSEVVGLERESVWEPEHVEDRLRDHYAGRKNKFVELEKLRDAKPNHPRVN